MIYIASDHAGFELKKILIDYLNSQGQKVVDCGPAVFDKSDDYPDFILPCAQMVAKHKPEARGIVIGYSGTGEAMAANKVSGVRAALYYGGDLNIVRLSRAHNNSNVISLGTHFLDAEQAKAAVDLWLVTEYEGGRHEARLKKIEDFESK
jgi:ribose 5-phosphate isomerase B